MYFGRFDNVNYNFCILYWVVNGKYDRSGVEAHFKNVVKRIGFYS